MDPNNARHMKRLRGAIEESRRQLASARDRRVEWLAQVTGRNYGRGLKKEETPAPLLELTISTIIYRLAARRPQVLVHPASPQLAPVAVKQQLAIDKLLDLIDIAETIRDAAQDAMYGPGIVMTGVMREGGYPDPGMWFPAGRPFALGVDLDDWVHDSSARHWNDCGFMGHRYRIPVDDELLDGDDFDRDLVQKYRAKSTRSDGDGTEQAASLTQPEGGLAEEYADFFEAWNLFLPRDRLILTLPLEGEDEDVLRTQEWTGPERGPYRILSFKRVPRSAMPLAPAGLWVDLHRGLNILYNKVIAEAKAQKQITTVPPGQHKFGEAIQGLNDGDVVPLARPDEIAKVVVGGISAELVALLPSFRDLYNYCAGNPEAIGGLSAQSETLGQDRMLAENAGAAIRHMQDRVYDFTKGIIEDLASHLWNDPLVDIPLTRPIQGTNLAVHDRWNAQQRKGQFGDYGFEIVPYSMQDQTPTSLLQSLTGIFQTFILPFQMQMAQQGIAINMPAMLRRVFQLANVPFPDEILTFMPPMPPQMAGPQGAGQGPPKPPVTTRNYVRTNQPGGARQGRDELLAQMMLGRSGMQPSQMAGAVRSGT